MREDERVEAHIAAQPAERQAPLRHVRGLLHAVLPAGEETIAYGMPCIAVRGKGVAGFDAFERHWSYFPMSGAALDAVPDLPAWAERSKGGLRMALDRRLTKALVRRLVRARLDEISAVTRGKRLEFFDDGSVKAEGGMRDGRLHGAWTWWRQDGTVLRTGRFADGEQVGVWTTMDRAGRPVKETRF